ncbi:hypothetical protein L8W40_01010 [Campylobacter sp. IFREMER_LSEM_CL1846]|uniref:hypothetical protein n=1 Tax=Campylobacter sp. IFREMER_LSEM_CL1846 TaxID=2911614 RepID=UPI0021E68A4B|nr:hypothetical protein [Campylobacter sp. IFREMER_LSEM_CL1846]MCV3433641.1 hypothetical protein [Campylobacter sp. IFREMER_LSEM_CL1846]
MQIQTYIKEALDKAEVIIITAGAGMGVDSGLPDFRGKEGFLESLSAFAKTRYRL